MELVIDLPLRPHRSGSLACFPPRSSHLVAVPTSSLSKIPPEIMLRVAFFMDAQDIIELSHTCRQMWNLLSSNSVWRALYQVVFRMSMPINLDIIPLRRVTVTPSTGAKIQATNEIKPEDSIFWKVEFMKVLIPHTCDGCPCFAVK